MKKYDVQLWSGRGYLLNPAIRDIEACDEEEALIIASMRDGFAFFVYDDEIKTDKERDELEKADNYLYLDRTEYGCRNIWLLIENARISEVA